MTHLMRRIGPLARRSFNPNYENNILLFDESTTQAVYARQRDYIAKSTEVSKEIVIAWPRHKRIWNNVIQPSDRFFELYRALTIMSDSETRY